MRRQRRAQVVSDSARGAFVRPKRVTLSSFLLDEWLPAKASGLRPSTVHSYGHMIRLYIVPSIGGAQLAAVDGSMLNVLYGRLLTEGRTENEARTRSGPISEDCAERPRRVDQGIP